MCEKCDSREGYEAGPSSYGDGAVYDSVYCYNGPAGVIYPDAPNCPGTRLYDFLRPTHYPWNPETY